jgi:hypothetical protein
MLDSIQRHNLKSLIIVPKLKTWLRKIWQNKDSSFELSCLEDQGVLIRCCIHAIKELEPFQFNDQTDRKASLSYLLEISGLLPMVIPKNDTDPKTR